MKLINKIMMMALMAVAITACDKVADLPAYKNGTTAVLSSSSATFAPAVADSAKPAITFSWTSPNYATDTTRFKYVLEIDSAGRNFTKAVTRSYIGVSSATFTAKEFNTILLGFGFTFGTTYGVDVRLTTSYTNNNERIVANTLKLNATPYKIPPKVALPSTSRLFITGNATTFDWTNPSPMPAVREFTRMDETTWVGIFELSGNGNYLILQEAGNWNDKFAVANKNLTGLANGGNFGFKLNDDFPADVKDGAGWYKLTFDFQTGTFKAEKQVNSLPAELYITGAATQSSWTNSPPAAQRFTQKTNGVFENTLSLVGGQSFLFLPVFGSWDFKYGGVGGNNANQVNGDGIKFSGSDLLSPATSGSYKMVVNFITGKYTVTKI